MKKRKSALGIVCLFAAAIALSSCDLVTASNKGSIFTYTDAQGNRVSYTAENLLNDYRQAGSSLSTEFDKVYEVLIRHYYNDASQKSTLKDLTDKATASVIKDKQTAKTNSENNKSSFEKEWETILSGKNCDDADELFQYYLYQNEKTKFEADYYQNFGTGNSAVNGVEAIKDGGYTLDGKTVTAFPESADWGKGNSGWLLEQMPYHLRHILVKLSSGKSGEFTQDKIGESTTTGEGGETTKLAKIIFTLAGADENLQPLTGERRWTFGETAKTFSDDGSASNLGDLAGTSSSGIMTKVMSSDLVNEYKLGVYAYESLYNKRETATTYGAANSYRITPGLTETATSTADVDSAQTLGDTTVNQFFKDEGIGQIPFGAALALFDNRKVVKDEKGNSVNEDNDTFFPRNVIYNKYFNKHNVCVITPNAIEMNATSALADSATVAAANSAKSTSASGKVSSENYNGVVSSQFTSLPGFQTSTTDVLPQFANNVLTDDGGHVVLAVRAGASSYQGIHFIVIERSALSQYGLDTTNKENTAAVDGTATLTQYYTTYTPASSYYPTYTDGGTSKSLNTWVNFNAQESSEWNTRSGNLVSDIKGYNSNISSYQFQSLVEGGSITFSDTSIEDELKTYSKTKRQSTTDDNFTSWSDKWKSYAELIEAQDEARAQGAGTGTGKLISEVCAVGYGNHAADDPLWTKGGACYYATK